MIRSESREMIRIKNMSFRELKNELAHCRNNPTKENIIRKLMKQKYIEHKKRKKHPGNSENYKRYRNHGIQ